MQKSFLIGIAGGTGSGKTTTAKFIARKLGTDRVVILSFDDYYRKQMETSLAERHETNYDHPDSLEHELLEKHLAALKRGEAIDKPVYDFASHDRKDATQKVGPKPVMIVEGILVLHFSKLRELFDITLFVDAPADVRFIRRLKRDIRERGRSVDSVIKQYIATVRPMHEQYVEPTKQLADKVISGVDGWEEMEKVVDSLRMVEK